MLLLVIADRPGCGDVNCMTTPARRKRDKSDSYDYRWSSKELRRTAALQRSDRAARARESDPESKSPERGHVRGSPSASELPTSRKFGNDDVKLASTLGAALREIKYHRVPMFCVAAKPRCARLHGRSIRQHL
jgi:hypothetical protein